MPRYLKQKNKNISGSSALKKAKRNIFWQAGLALITIILTVVILFAMTSAWYTNIVQTSGLAFEAEAWGFDGQIVVNDQSIKAAPGDEGNIHLEVTNANEGMTAVGVSASKAAMGSPEMQQRLYFYVDTQMVRNGETMERVYLNSLSSYTYTLFGQSNLTLKEDMHNDVPLKWQWVYDMLGYYVLGSFSEGKFTEIEYLRPVEYDYDKATFDYVTSEDGLITIELKTVDGKTTVEEFLKTLSKTDGYEKDIDYKHSVDKKYYPVEVDEEGYGVYVYLSSVAEIEMATQFDTQLGQGAANTPLDQTASYPVTLTVSAQKNDEDVLTVATLSALNSALEQMSGSTVQLADDITLTGNDKIVIPEGVQVIVDLNGKSIKSETDGNAVEAKEGSSAIFMNGTIEGSNGNAGVYAVGADLTLNKVNISNFVDCISVGDHAAGNSRDSKIRLVSCTLTGNDSAVYISGNGSITEQKTQLIVDHSILKSDNIVIFGNGSTSGNGRWGTDIQILDSTLESNAANKGVGIFHPQPNSTLTIYNSMVSGYTGVVIKGGFVSVKASTVTGAANVALGRDPNPSNSGCDDTGDGIYIEANYGYEIRLEITGADVLQEDGSTGFKTSTISSTNNQSLRVWEPDAANATVKIYSGQFKEQQPENYIAAGSKQTGSNGKYVVTE